MTTSEKEFSGCKDRFGFKINIGDFVEIDDKIYLIKKTGGWIVPVDVTNSCSIGELKDFARKATLLKVVPALKLKMAKAIIEEAIDSGR